MLVCAGTHTRRGPKRCGPRGPAFLTSRGSTGKEPGSVRSQPHEPDLSFVAYSAEPRLFNAKKRGSIVPDPEAWLLDYSWDTGDGKVNR